MAYRSILPRNLVNASLQRHLPRIGIVLPDTNAYWFRSLCLLDPSDFSCLTCVPSRSYVELLLGTNPIVQNPQKAAPYGTFLSYHTKLWKAEITSINLQPGKLFHWLIVAARLKTNIPVYLICDHFRSFFLAAKRRVVRVYHRHYSLSYFSMTFHLELMLASHLVKLMIPNPLLLANQMR